MNSQEYPRYFVIYDSKRPVRITSAKSIPESPTRQGGWEPFLDIESLLEDSDRVDENVFYTAVADWTKGK